MIILVLFNVCNVLIFFRVMRFFSLIVFFVFVLRRLLCGFCRYNFDNISDGFYIVLVFMDKLVIYVVKNFMNLLGIKILFIFGIWGGKG